MKKKPKPLNLHSIYGALGGKVVSQAKSRAAKRNGKKGGRPKKIHAVPPHIYHGNHGGTIPGIPKRNRKYTTKFTVKE